MMDTLPPPGLVKNMNVWSVLFEECTVQMLMLQDSALVGPGTGSNPCCRAPTFDATDSHQNQKIESTRPELGGELMMKPGQRDATGYGTWAGMY